MLFRSQYAVATTVVPSTNTATRSSEIVAISFTGTLAKIATPPLALLLRPAEGLARFSTAYILDSAVSLKGSVWNVSTVKIDGIGTFTPALALVKGKEREEDDEEGRKRNARSIVVGKVNFRAEKELIWNINGRLSLERASWKRKRSSDKYTKEQRLEILKEALDKNPFITVLDYCRLTGLVRSTATIEIREWAQQPESGIGTMGTGSHRVYVKRKEMEL